MVVSGKIKSKTVKSGTYGDLIVFQVGGQTLSVFGTDKKVSEEAKQVIRDLQEGDSVEFEVAQRQGKDGKMYNNIVGATRVTQLNEHEEVPAVQPVGRGETKESGDTRVRSMALAYAKDVAIASIGLEAGTEVEPLSWDNIIARAKRFEHYILTGE